MIQDTDEVFCHKNVFSISLQAVENKHSFDEFRNKPPKLPISTIDMIGRIPSLY